MQGSDFNRAFDGVIAFLVGIGLLVGLVIGAIAYLLIPWLWKHLSITWQ